MDGVEYEEKRYLYANESWMEWTDGVELGARDSVSSSRITEQRVR